MSEAFETPEEFRGRFLESPEGKGVTARAEVLEIAKDHPDRALVIARRIGHAWYRCQALTTVVEKNPSLPSAQAVLDEAFDAAFSQVEPNRVAAVSLWPLRQQMRLSPEIAGVRVNRLLEVIRSEPHSLRRLDGVARMLYGVVENASLRARILPTLVEAARESRGWRSERILATTAQLMAPFDRQAAHTLLAFWPASKFTKRALHEIAKGEHGP